MVWFRSFFVFYIHALLLRVTKTESRHMGNKQGTEKERGLSVTDPNRLPLEERKNLYRVLVHNTRIAVWWIAASFAFSQFMTDFLWEMLIEHVTNATDRAIVVGSVTASLYLIALVVTFIDKLPFPLSVTWISFLWAAECLVLASATVFMARIGSSELSVCNETTGDNTASECSLYTSLGAAGFLALCTAAIYMRAAQSADLAWETRTEYARNRLKSKEAITAVGMLRYRADPEAAVSEWWVWFSPSLYVGYNAVIEAFDFTTVHHGTTISWLGVFVPVVVVVGMLVAFTGETPVSQTLIQERVAIAAGIVTQIAAFELINDHWYRDSKRYYSDIWVSGASVLLTVIVTIALSLYRSRRGLDKIDPIVVQDAQVEAYRIKVKESNKI